MQTEWEQEIDGDIAVASCTDASRVAYVERGGAAIRVISPTASEEHVIDAERVDDLGFKDAGHLFLALRDGGVRVLSLEDQE